MTGRATLLPVAMVAVIAVLGLIAIMSGRSNAPDVTVDAAYPHHVCTFSEYCEGDICTRKMGSFVAYLEHLDTQPRLEIPRVNPDATLARTADGLEFETSGGLVRGTLTIFGNRSLNWIGFSGDPNNPVEHYGSGSCERLKNP